MSEEDSRVIAKTEVDDKLISTTFLPICMTFEDGSPQAFETVVVRGQKSRTMKRYADLAEALHGHDLIVACEQP